MANSPTKPEYDIDEEVDVLELTDRSHSLIVWNDEVNTFE